MLNRVQSPSNPSNVVQRLSLEPSQYLENLKTLITKKQTELNNVALSMKKSVEVLEENTQLMKQRLITLETARKTLEEHHVNNTEIIKNNQNNAEKVSELERQNNELQEEKSKIEKEISTQLDKIHSLELTIEEKEQDWNANKFQLLNQLKQFQETQLLPGLDEIEKVMKLTNSKIDASNMKLKKYMSGEMEFGNDPFVSIGKKFKEKFLNNEELFNENYFGQVNDEDEEQDEENDDEEQYMNFGKVNDEELELDEDEELELDIDDEEDDEEEDDEDED